MMKKNLSLPIILIIFIILLISPIFSIDTSKWTNYSACDLGRLQSPIKLNEYDSTYSNTFSFVYQNYKTTDLSMTNKYTLIWNVTNNEGGYVNFEKQGVIKQYELKRIELYPGEHDVDGQKGDYELHLIHKKNLDFNTNKNQYRKIVDANMYLTVVLRYKQNCNQSENTHCISDDGLLSALFDNTGITNFNLNNYPIYQDKRAYLYEGSFLHIPCDENVNYYVIKDFFYTSFNLTNSNDLQNNNFFKTKSEADRYGRPVLKNFMNYREFLGSKYLDINIYIFLIIYIIFNF